MLFGKEAEGGEGEKEQEGLLKQPKTNALENQSQESSGKKNSATRGRGCTSHRHKANAPALKLDVWEMQGQLVHGHVHTALLHIFDLRQRRDWGAAKGEEVFDFAVLQFALQLLPHHIQHLSPKRHQKRAGLDAEREGERVRVCVCVLVCVCVCMCVCMCV